MEEPRDLLQRYVETGSEEAFRQLVFDHIDLVHATALRILGGNRSLAEEVTQTVFVSLARKAGGLSPRVVLSAWLYRHSRFTALRARRAEHRRIEREKQASMTSENDDSEGLWRRLAPFLDDAMGRLRESDRGVLAARYLQGKDLRAVGQEFGLSEDAAQKRVARALEKLRLRLGKRGIVSTATLLAHALNHAAILGAARGIVAKIAQGALAPSAALVARNSLISWLLMKKTILTSISLAAVLGVGGIWLGSQWWKPSPTEKEQSASGPVSLLVQASALNIMPKTTEEFEREGRRFRMGLEFYPGTYPQTNDREHRHFVIAQASVWEARGKDWVKIWETDWNESSFKVVPESQVPEMARLIWEACQGITGGSGIPDRNLYLKLSSADSTQGPSSKISSICTATAALVYPTDSDGVLVQVESTISWNFSVRDGQVVMNEGPADQAHPPKPREPGQRLEVELIGPTK